VQQWHGKRNGATVALSKLDGPIGIGIARFQRQSDLSQAWFGSGNVHKDKDARLAHFNQVIDAGQQSRLCHSVARQFQAQVVVKGRHAHLTYRDGHIDRRSVVVVERVVGLLHPHRRDRKIVAHARVRTSGIDVFVAEIQALLKGTVQRTMNGAKIEWE
jgi:hypothetical protein